MFLYWRRCSWGPGRLIYIQNTNNFSDRAVLLSPPSPYQRLWRNNSLYLLTKAQIPWTTNSSLRGPASSHEKLVHDAFVYFWPKPSSPWRWNRQNSDHQVFMQNWIMTVKTVQWHHQHQKTPSSVGEYDNISLLSYHLHVVYDRTAHSNTGAICTEDFACQIRPQYRLTKDQCHHFTCHVGIILATPARYPSRRSPQFDPTTVSWRAPWLHAYCHDASWSLPAGADNEDGWPILTHAVGSPSFAANAADPWHSPIVDKVGVQILTLLNLVHKFNSAIRALFLLKILISRHLPG